MVCENAAQRLVNHDGAAAEAIRHHLPAGGIDELPLLGETASRRLVSSLICTGFAINRSTTINAC